MVNERFDVLVAATGQLNRPSFPDIPGRGASPARPSTRPPGATTVDLAGQRVAVIGTGASAAQFVPCVVGEVAHLDLYQRTPPWLLPTDNYGDPFSPAFGDLLDLFPGYGRWDRLWQFWLMHEGLLPAARVDEGGSDFSESVGVGQRLRAHHAAGRVAGPSPDDDLYERWCPASRPSPSGRCVTTAGGRPRWPSPTST